jgi:hypothetical protein
MKQYCFTVECDAQTHTTTWVTREFKYLVGKQCPEGSEFIQALGMFDDFSVAKGQDSKAWTTKSRVRILEAGKRLLERVRQDRDYVGYDYQCGFSAEGRHRHSGRGFGVRLPGRDALIWLHPGQIYMEFHERGQDGKFHVVETVDLRTSGPMQTESQGLLKVYKRSNPINWEQKLPSLIDFLGGHSGEIVRVRYHYPEEPSR